jgi:stage V sporulation protein B
VSKAVKMAKVSAKGGFHLFWGVAASTVISAVGTILMARFLSPTEYGLFAVALMAPNLIVLFRDWGVNSAIIKYTAQYVSENKTANVKSILVGGLLFELVLGSYLSFISFLLSGFLATNIFQRPDITPLVQIASFTILAGALMTAAQSALIGYEKMKLNSITMISLSTLKTVLASLLVILGLGAFGAIVGTTIGLLIAGLVSILMLYIALHKNLHGPNAGEFSITETVKTMFKYGLPLSISAILSGFLAQFYSILMAIVCTDLLIGNYQVAVNFAVLITFFAAPITTVLFPAFSKLNPQKEAEILRNVFQFSVKYSALLVVPAAAIIIALSQPAISTLFGEEYTYAPLYLTLIAISYLYSAFGSLSLGNLLNSQGKTAVNLKLTLITSAIGFPLSLLLIPKFGIIGLIITTLTAGIPSLIIALWLVKKYFTATIDWASSVKIFLASALATIITYVIISQLNLPNWIKLTIGALIFLITYVTTIPLIGAIDKTDIQNLTEMLKELGLLSSLFELLLNIIEKLTRVGLKRHKGQNTKTTKNT